MPRGKENQDEGDGGMKVDVLIIGTGAAGLM
jgi:hypothetical protein